MADLQSVVDHHSTIPDEAIRDAAKSIRVAQGRQRFSLDNLLPSDLAKAVAMVTDVFPYFFQIHLRDAHVRRATSTPHQPNGGDDD